MWPEGRCARGCCLDALLVTKGDAYVIFTICRVQDRVVLAMPSPLDVRGTIRTKTALIIVAVLAAGLTLVWTPISVIGYILLAAASALYIIASVYAVLR